MTTQRLPWYRVFLESWNEFWFAPADPTTLGFMRIGTGILVFWVLFCYSFDLQEFMGEHAWLSRDYMNESRDPHLGSPRVLPAYDWIAPPADANKLPDDATPEEKAYYDRWGQNPRLAKFRGYPAFSIWFHVSDPRTMNILHGCFLAIAVLFTIGFCTRITSVMLWMAAISYTQRSPASVFGMDTMMNILLIYLMIGPSGAALSVDRLIKHWWARREARRVGQPLPAWQPPEPLVSANFTIRMVQIHLCIIYFIAGAAKLKGPAWWSHTAVWGTMINPEFCPIGVKPYFAFVQFLCNHRPLWEIFMSMSGAFTLFMELGFAFLVWNRHTRWLMVTCAVLLHLGIAFFLGLTIFSSFMLCLVLSFVPVEQIHRLLRFLRVERASGPTHKPRTGEHELLQAAGAL